MSIKANFHHFWNQKDRQRKFESRAKLETVDWASQCLWLACNKFLSDFRQIPESLRLARSPEEVTQHLALVDEELSMLQPIFFKLATECSRPKASWRLTTGYVKDQVRQTNQRVTFAPARNVLPV